LQLCNKVQDKLGEEYRVVIGMRYGNPSLLDALEQLKTCEQITVLPLYPQYSSAATGSSSNVIACTPNFGTAGLTFGARVSKIDDNGFVTFNLSPSVSASTPGTPVTGCGPINILSVRRLDTGSVRVRDGQTLILTGVISDFNSQTVDKWPILGDLPLVGQFFRSSGGSREKRELVIMVTANIVTDTDGGGYGYGYQPASSESRQLMGAGQGRF
jgi:type IV pilus assembly protein PilQ